MEKIQGVDPNARTSGTSEDLAQMAVVVETPQVMPMRPVLGPELGGLTCSSLELMTTRWAFFSWQSFSASGQGFPKEENQ